MGLSIVKNLVTLMAGEIKILSPAYKPESGFIGTEVSFTLLLPILSNQTKDSHNQAQAHQLHFKREIYVLLADDVKVNQILAEIMLNGLGCQVDFADDGQQAIDMLRKKDYDIIFMDIQMPVLDGYDATRVIRNSYERPIPVIGLSANVYVDDLKKSISAGMNEHIGKPYTEKQLYDVISKWVTDAI